MTQKIFLGLAAFALVFSAVIFSGAGKAFAQGYPVIDAANLIENVIDYIENSVTAEATLGQDVEDTILDKVATAIAKQLLMQITESVVNWINSGFNGNPAFIQNPAAFFQNVGDQATGAFISQNGALSSLCSPFSLQIRLAVAAQQEQNDGYGGNGSGGVGGGNQYSCTLSTIIQNTTNAVNGASVSVQGFIGGDFSQGGFPAFAALVTEPQNNPNGAYLDAEDQLEQTISAQTAQKQNELSQGSGFLSWETCTPTSDDSSDIDDDGDDDGDDSAISAGDTDDDGGTSINNDDTDESESDNAGLSATDDNNDSDASDIDDNNEGENSAISAADNNDEAEGDNGSISAADNDDNNSDTANIDDNNEGDNSAVLAAESDNDGEQLNDNDDSDDDGTSMEAGDADDPYGTAEEDDSNEDCETQTPGSVISATLNKHLAVPTENLELADSINDIINAAFSQLVVVALQQGLTSVSKGSSANGGASYLQSAVTSATQQTFTSTQQQMLTTITPYLTNAQEINQNYGTAFGLIQSASSTYEQASLCYQNILNATTTSLYPAAIPYLEGQISTIQTEIASSVEPIASTILAKDSSASSTDSEYQTMYNQTKNATSLADLSTPNQTLSDISETAGFPTTGDVQASENDLTTYESDIQPVQQQANTALNECQTFNYSAYASTGDQ